MLLLNTPPATDSDELAAYYRRYANEGAVFRGTMTHEHFFGLSDSFDPRWGSAAVCWCAGGVENYQFPRRGSIRLKAGAVLTIGEHERYAFMAEAVRPFLSSMIIFPTSMTRSLGSNALTEPDDAGDGPPIMETRLFKPETSLLSRMEAVAVACASGAGEPDWFEQQATLIASALFTDQLRNRQRPDRVKAVKPATRRELVRRLGRAVELMHDRYEDSSLDLSLLAHEACIARHHFVRVFAAVYGVTPLRYLGDIRLQAAARLLESLDAPVAEIAGAVGFTSRSAFQRRFHLHFGVTPAAWRRSQHARIRGLPC